MLTALLARQKDGWFVIATPESELPSSTPEAKVVIVRGGSWRAAAVTGWDIEILLLGAVISNDISRALLARDDR
ncbi:MAG: hypothetical protein OXE94_10050 [Aestuariivita sp.]|nr:hypothetical protein [Aestuariivita sp.]MCY4201709.1 hypothetical protein [Aestuariivita sp.]MCY4289444.1 hypothetical protein [Aestuariivita sp.]MCY4347349.1 hypothetical protein [Aestuariivita sp.]